MQPKDGVLSVIISPGTRHCSAWRLCRHAGGEADELAGEAGRVAGAGGWRDREGGGGGGLLATEWGLFCTARKWRSMIEPSP